MNNKQVPEIRFKEFSKEWNFCILKDMLIISRGERITKKSVQNSGYPIISGGTGIFGYYKDFNRNPNIITIAQYGSAGFVNLQKEKFWANDVCYCIDTKNVIDNYFMYSFLLSKQLYIYSLVNNNAIPSSISSESIYNIQIPKIDNDEALKIGKFFLTLNNLIALYKKKCEKLEIIRKSLIENVFIDLGFNQPNIRFKEFNSKWINKTFSELYKKNTVKNSNLKYDENNVISVANMYFKSDVKISNEEYLKTYNIFKIGDIAFEGNKSKNFTCGRFVENTIGDGIISHVFEVFSPIIEYDLWFWKYLINNEKIMKNILMKSTKATTMMSNLVSKDFLEQKIKLPELKEQTKIGILLNTISYNITLCKRKCEKLENIKKSLLEKMFI
ncbi:restriction endonuclease subunit S [Ureaplasma ceti]|uniref:Type I restriction modification DNA specificity domain-containing protein n=1 Tax=Ureaplasma ceti TaxID=3119530 RepID=A0ABP9U7F0_9BACT